MNIEYAIKSDLILEVPPKRFKEGGRLHYYVRIYIDAQPTALNAVELVKYTLHPTFKERYRISMDRSNCFELRLWTYGYFDIQAAIVMKDGRTQNITGYVEWRIPDGMPFDDDP